MTLLVFSLADNAVVSPISPRAQAATTKSSSDFKDVGGLPQDVKNKLDALLRDGVFDGVADDVFGVDHMMNRAQFAKVAAIIFSLPIDRTLSQSSFADVSADDPANGYALPFIEALKTAGLTNGVDAEGKMYNPAGTVTRQELAAFLVRGLKWEAGAKSTAPIADATVDDWANGYVAHVLDKKLMDGLPNGSFGGTTAATRLMLALASYNARQAAPGAAVGGDGGTMAPALPAGIPVAPTGIEIDGEDVLLSVGDTYYDADGRITTTRQQPVIPLKVTGPNNYEFTPSQIETLYNNGFIAVAASGGIELDSPAIGQSDSGLGKIVIKEVQSAEDITVAVKLTHAQAENAVASHTFQTASMRIPASIEVSSKDMALLAENEQPQGFAFTIKDQYGKVFKAPSSQDTSHYAIKYKLERLSGLPSLQSAGGIFDTPWNEGKSAINSGPNSSQTWQLPIDKSGDAYKFMFKSNLTPVDPEGSQYTISATVINQNTNQELASAAANLEVYNWKDLDPLMTYEVDMLSSHFAAGKYLSERALISGPTDIDAVNAKYPFYGKEVNIIATDNKNRRIDITKVVRDDLGKPASVVQHIAPTADNVLMGAPGINSNGIPVYRAFGIQPSSDLFDLEVTFYTPSGVKTLKKRQIEVVYGEPVARAVAVKNPVLHFSLSTPYKIRKLNGIIEEIKGSDYLASQPTIWEFLKFCDFNGLDTKDESNFFKYFIQTTDQFGHKYQNTSDNKILDLTKVNDVLKVKVVIDMDNKYPAKWSVKDEALRDKIWIDDQMRLHYEPHARNADGSFDYAKRNLQSFGIQLITPSDQRSWCNVTLND
ncbi:S-layer homology domain-containing protein [Paenibacillus chartarius]|uniref:S-layer homology domain-containing protein n=1 Tax=Paenibacillus chartarius TaxID=747481 RepID=A0ABV6DT51_9BACL